MGCSVTIGFIYPAYQSYKALEGKRSDDAAEWLTYWVIFSLFTVFESIADWFISWIPFYYIFKLVLLLWLLLPQFKGASKVYHRVLQPLMRRHEAQIDERLSQGIATARSLSSQGMQLGSQLFNRRSS